MGHHPYPPMQGIMPGRWGPQGGSRNPIGPPLATSLADISLSNVAIHDFTAALQGVATAGLGAALTSPSPEALTGKAVTLSLLQLRFICEVAGYGDLPPI